MSTVAIKPPPKLKDLYLPNRYKILKGGRGGGKSYGIRDFLLTRSLSERCRIGCFREIQNTIRDSSYKLIKDGIYQYGLQGYYRITNSEIIALNTGAEFLFKGLRYSVDEIKSTEGIKYAWVEEAQNVSSNSWDVLIPTIRVQDSEIIVSYNPQLESDATHQRFVVNQIPGSTVIDINYWDNPYFPDTLRAEMEHCKKYRYEDYLHIWEGKCVVHAAAQVFNRKFEAKTFEVPDNIDRWYIGADWGFSQDPTAIVAFYIYDGCLWIRYEAGGVGIEFEELPDLFDSIGDETPHEGIAREWPIYADSARPETISYVKRKGFNISSADKWEGSVKDGIAYLKGFKKIYIHTDCKRTLDEFKLYSYKVDRITEEILPVIVDKYNHYIDAIRYGLYQYIKAGFSDYGSLF